MPHIPDHTTQLTDRELLRLHQENEGPFRYGLSTLDRHYPFTLITVTILKNEKNKPRQVSCTNFRHMPNLPAYGFRVKRFKRPFWRDQDTQEITPGPPNGPLWTETKVVAGPFGHMMGDWPELGTAVEPPSSRYPQS